MISFVNVKRYCKNYTEIENYELAIKDEEHVWECHHRLEIAPFSGKAVSHKYLKTQGLYYNQQPEALIFLKCSDHNCLHKKGQNIEFTAEHKRKISEALKGRKHTEEHRKHNSEAHKGVVSRKGFHLSDETKAKLSIAAKNSDNSNNHTNLGRHMYTNGITNVFTVECPEGFWPGATRKDSKNGKNSKSK